jgi:lipopolysaccharide/colanic/teichoic acid biosynthesis glycosyltransferase
MTGEPESFSRLDAETERTEDHASNPRSVPDLVDDDTAFSATSRDRGEAASTAVFDQAQVSEGAPSIVEAAATEPAASQTADLAIDLRLTEPSVTISHERVAVPTDHPEATRPVVDVGALLERHLAGTRLARVVALHDLADDQRPGRIYHLAKRGADIAVAIILLLVLIPILLLAAAAVRLTSHGPVLYQHRRHGIGGAEFMMFKFRSMVDGADLMLDEMEDLAAKGEIEALDEIVFKASDDPRITPVGRFLRRTNLDEIPQLLNVIAGHMSLVGPRPLVTAEIETLSDPVSDRRHSVAPGITCLWQVARLEDTSFAERMALDLLYVDRRAALLDSYLFVLTPLSVFRGVRSH